MARSRPKKRSPLSAADTAPAAPSTAQVLDDAVLPAPAERVPPPAPAAPALVPPPTAAPAPEHAAMASDLSSPSETPSTSEGLENLSFGRYLVKARESKNLSLDDLAHLTKIRRAIVEALETDARTELPEKVFVLGYVRSYAAAAGLNVEDTVRRFNASWVDDEAAVTAEEEAGQSRSLAWLPPTIASLIAGGAIWFIVTHLR